MRSIICYIFLSTLIVACSQEPQKEADKKVYSSEFKNKLAALNEVGDLQDPDYHFALSRLYFEEGIYDEALTAIDDAISMQRDEAYILFKANLLHKEGKYEQVIDLLTKEKNGNEGSYLYNKLLAGSYLKTGNTKLAKKHVDYCLEINPEGSDFYAISGEIAKEEKRYTEAEKLFQQALQFNPSDKTIILALIELNVDQKLQEKALYYLKRGYSIDSGFVSYIYYDAVLNMGIKDDSVIISLFKRVLAEDPSYRNAKVELAKLLVKQKDFDAAIPLLKELENKEDTVYYLLGLSFEAKKDYENALTAFEKYANIRPNNLSVKRKIALQKWRINPPPPVILQPSPTAADSTSN